MMASVRPDVFGDIMMSVGEDAICEEKPAQLPDRVNRGGNTSIRRHVDTWP
jgi:hypothetical protein